MKHKKMSWDKTAGIAGIVSLVFSAISTIASLGYTLWLAKRTKKSNEEIGKAAGTAYYECGHPKFKETIDKHKNIKTVNAK